MTSCCFTRYSTACGQSTARGSRTTSHFLSNDYHNPFLCQSSFRNLVPSMDSSIQNPPICAPLQFGGFGPIQMCNKVATLLDFSFGLVRLHTDLLLRKSNENKQMLPGSTIKMFRENLTNPFPRPQTIRLKPHRIVILDFIIIRLSVLPSNKKLRCHP